MNTEENVPIKDSKKSSYQFWTAAKNGILKDVVQWSDIFRDDVLTLSKSLLQACEMGHLDIVKWLIDHTGADVNYLDIYTPLTAACRKQHLDVVTFLVNKLRTDVNLPNFFGYTPLIQACRASSISVSTYLLIKVDNLDINFLDNKFNTALHYAIWCSEYNFTRLHRACENGNTTEVERLIYVEKHGINALDDNGDTPLHIACRAGYSDIVSALMIQGADETLSDDDCLTPADVARLHKHYDLLKLLDRDSLWEVIVRGRRPWNRCVVPFLTILAISRKIATLKVKPRGKRVRPRGN